MKYSLDEFIALTERIEAQGGELLPDTHEPTYVEMRKPGGETYQLRLAACRRLALFDVPYDDYRTDEPRAITVCAVDDAMGLWPRFQETT